MKPENILRLFEETVHHWIVELGLNDKYKIKVKRDNRISGQAITIKEDAINYTIAINTKRNKTKSHVISAALHEVGHFLHTWQGTSDFKAAEHEYLAELFSLKTAKQFYSDLYPEMLQQTKNACSKKTVDNIHVEGYLHALSELGESIF
jgi:predicted HD phosphohydrolase